ncbi:heat shock 70 kDa protein 14 [Takifugu rubripes]|uniref:Heat shock 70 kDa protein 14 n=1 Tax=Takifugu rubripes TaxID=31033 RepID=H2U4F1_TAKRU|nr:heat shock 70 kDa protein 14 [Takifugu rubripes]|eukprot:XP_003972691.2 PREDICTED: heat shock 70 kDa protein 14 [Takifugu rubripes]
MAPLLTRWWRCRKGGADKSRRRKAEVVQRNVGSSVFLNMTAIGVHLGCSSACVAVFKDGRAEVVANDAGDRITPAVVAYRDNEQIVGVAARQGRVWNSANTVVKVKQLLGRRFNHPETQLHRSQTKCPVINREERPFYEITTGEHIKYVAPEDAAKVIFKKMRETAQSALGSNVTEVVVAVPVEFAPAQKKAMRDAAQGAGLNVLRLIHEPAAALLAYNIGQNSSSGRSHVLVYKLGGASLSVTVMQVNGGIYRVLNTHTDPSVGGESFTEALAQHLATEFKRTFKHDVSSNARAMLKLMNGADMAKHSLSLLGSANCFVDSLHNGIDFECTVSRARFESLCSSLFSKSVQPIRGLLESVGLSTSDINQVVLCGGSTRIPRLQTMIRDIFPHVDLLSSAPPDELIAVGAALEAGLLVGHDGLGCEEEPMAVDVSATDILVKEVDESGAEVFTTLLPSGTPLPARRHHILTGQGTLSSVSIDVYQRWVSRPPEKLAKIVLRDLQLKEEKHSISTVLTMKRDGSIHVSCVEQSGGRPEVVAIASKK